ncbi:MAG: putative minor capsid protein 10B [Prokaryotic dsDNA virus sp.]|nr:MAG: putative minor capsid protein 10B [Prokaryotic dsDNA virus sp.]|tara:strand:+ start:18761 stop:19987 length:1227 start_codon:yes stop_codon:yes gene_type:complete
MSNALITTSKITRHAVKEFLNNLQIASKVDRQLDKEFRKIGETISVRRPVMFTSSDGATLGAAEDIEEVAASVILDQRKHVHFAITSKDLTLSIEDFNTRYIQPAMAELAQQVESSLADSYKQIGNFVGTPGTAPSTFLEVGAAAKVLSKLGTPMNVRWNAFYDEDASLALADGLKSVFPSEIAKKAIEEAAIGRYSKFMLYENQSLKLHTVGVATGTPLVNGASQNVTYANSGAAWQQSLATDGWTNSTGGILLGGDVITIAGVNSVNRRTRVDTGDLQTFVVKSDAASGASTGPASLTISPPMITSGPYQTVTAAPADGAAITVKTGSGGSKHKQNLAFHENAITLAMAPLDLPTQGAEASRESFDNVSIRTVTQYAIGTDTTTYRFDILYGVKAQNPDFAVRTTS